MKNILICVDFQEGFLLNDNAIRAKDNADALIESGIFDGVIATQYVNFENSTIAKLANYNAMIFEHEIPLSSKAAQADHILVKHRYSAYSPEMTEYLKEENGGDLPRAVYIAGLDTECCVMMTAAEFFENGIRPIVLADYCGSSQGEASHQAGLLALQSLIGQHNIYEGKITHKEQVTDILRRAETKTNQA